MQNIDSDLIRGNIDTIILKTMMNGDMYGLDIIREVQSKSNGTYELKQPTLYSCLKRLENQELISSYWLDSDIGGKRHYYKLTDKGRETIKSKQEEWSKSKFIIDNLLGDFDSEQYRLVKKDDYERIIEGKPVIKYIPAEAAPDETENTASTDEQFISDNFESETVDGAASANADEDEIKGALTSETESGAIPSQPEEQTKTQSQPAPLTFSEYQTMINSAMSNSVPEEVPAESDIYVIKQNSNSENSDINSGAEKQSTVRSIFENVKESNRENVQPDNSVQQNLFDNVLYPYQNEVDKSILEFNNSISSIYNFEGNETPAPETPETPYESASVDTSSSAPEPAKAELANIEEETDSSDGVKVEGLNKELLSELDTLRIQNTTNFDIHDYPVDAPEQQYEENAAEKNAKSDYFAPENTQISPEQEEKGFVDYKIEEDNEENTYTQQDYDAISDKIYGFERDEPEDYFTFNEPNYFPVAESGEYKKKLQNLTEYAKISPNNAQNNEKMTNSKDIQVLKKEFEKEGIKVKQYTKTFGEKLTKEYLLINKLNLIKSLILMFAFAFILSGSYIIMNNTKLAEMKDFSVKYFLLAMIPFIIYFLYYVIIFAFNPRKKIPSRYSSRIMMFFSVIVTIQLLLIIYCINLQFGFYSFSQAGYNHLLWIVPSILSLTPIVTTAIHIILYHSKNFNI